MNDDSEDKAATFFWKGSFIGIGLGAFFGFLINIVIGVNGFVGAGVLAGYVIGGIIGLMIYQINS